MLAFAKNNLDGYWFNICAILNYLSITHKCQSLVYYNILKELNIEALVHMYNIRRNIRSATSVQIAKTSILSLAVSVFLSSKNGFSYGAMHFKRR